MEHFQPYPIVRDLLTEQHNHMSKDICDGTDYVRIHLYKCINCVLHIDD